LPRRSLNPEALRRKGDLALKKSFYIYLILSCS